MIEKRITYAQENNGRKNIRLAKKPKPKPNGNVIDLHPYLNDEWWNIETPKPNDADEVRGGLESLLASADDDFNFYYGILSRYYTPKELRGKTLKELDEMLQLHISVEGGLI